MARNSNRRQNKNQATIFDIPGMADELPVHPSIADFALHFPGNRSSDGADDIGSPLADEIEPSPATPSPMLFLSFGSGSSGNCTYVGTHREGVLIDAGVDAKTVIDGLRDNGLSIDCVKGICLTHDHSDHVRFIYTIVRKHTRIGVYCTPKILSGILRRHSLSRRIKDYHRPIYKEFPFTVAGMEITAFDVSHDGTDNNGFFISRDSQSLAIATDLGCITPRVDHYMRQASHIMIEANYDAHMLATGPYPIYLRARIEADRGHLDNAETARFVASVYSPALKHIFLCHLSNDNNTPEKAVEAVRNALLDAGADGVGDGSNSIESRQCAVQLAALPRYGTSPLYILR